MTRSPLILLALLAGCSSASSPGADATPDLVAVADAVAAEGSSSCTGPFWPAGVTVAEGGRLRVAATLPAGATLSLPELPEGWTGRVVDGAAELRAPYGSAGAQTIAAVVECPGGSAAAALSVTVRAIAWQPFPAWTPGPAGPRAREHPMLWIDERDPERLLLYGGELFEPKQYTLTNELWSYDLRSGRWQAHEHDGPLWSAGRSVPVPEQPARWVFGGDTGEAAMKLWRFEYGATPPQWIELSSLPAASSLVLHGLAYDRPRARLISACGVLHCSVVAIDPVSGATKELQPAGKAPSPRYGFFFAHDEEHERLILFGGAQEPTAADPVNPSQEVWALWLGENPVRWELLRPAGPTPPGSRNGCGAFDSAGQRLWVWSGTPDARTSVEGLWALQLERGAERWVKVEPAAPAPKARSSCAAVHDPQGARVLVGFGNNSSAIYADLWELTL